MNIKPEEKEETVEWTRPIEQVRVNTNPKRFQLPQMGPIKPRELKEEKEPIKQESKTSQALNVVNVDNLGVGGQSGRQASNVVNVDNVKDNRYLPVVDRVGVGKGAPGPSREVTESIQRAMSKRRLGDNAIKTGVVPSYGAQPSRAREGGTVSLNTLEQYARRGRLLFSNYLRELGIVASIDEVSPVEWVNWLLSRKPSLKSSTWRMYRQSALHLLEGFPGKDAEDAIVMLENDIIDRSRDSGAIVKRAKIKNSKKDVQESGEEESDEEDNDPDEITNANGDVTNSNKEKKTSALKEKRLPLEDLARIETYLAKFSRSKLSNILLDWLYAGILTALRPVEWRATELQEIEDDNAPYGRRAYLYVINAKATNGRGTGQSRTLDLSSFPDLELSYVRRMSERGREWLEKGRFADMQSRCSLLLYQTTGKIWPNRRYAYALYSARHQAIANWKVIMQPDEIAALVGHGITATATTHYGKKRSSWQPAKIPAPPHAVPEELSLIRHRIKLWGDRKALELQVNKKGATETMDFPI